MQLDIVEQLKQERSRLAGQLDKLDAALDALTGEKHVKQGKHVKQMKNSSSITAPVGAEKRTMSAATRAKISRAMKARHAGIKAKK